MLIRYVRLNNIRSYTDHELTFPEGSVLLSGDIGAGKSSILLAIEFALFGIKAGELSGESLLRHGARDGAVELGITVDGKDIHIKRTLKRNKDSVKQESGHIVIDGVKTDGTAVELKSRIYTLLGYPQSLVSRSKDLIYRYTVYTPQEQMKQIVSEDSDSRLDTLRRVFGIDKYKRIRENALEYAKELRSKRRELEAKASDIEEKKQKMLAEETDLKAYELKLAGIAPKLEQARKEIAGMRQSIEQAKAKTQELSRIQGELNITEVKRKSLLDQRRRNMAEMFELSEALEKELPEQADIDGIRAEIRESEKRMDELQKHLRHVSMKSAEEGAIERSSKAVKDKIRSISKCPMCEQVVTEEHKRCIDDREDKRILECLESIKSFRQREEEARKGIEKEKSHVSELRKAESAASLAGLRRKELQEKKAKHERLSKEQESLRPEIEALNTKREELAKLIDQYKGIQDTWGKLEKDFSGLLEKEKLLQIQDESVKVRIENCRKQMDQLSREIQEKDRFRKEADRLAGIQNWLSEAFISLTTVMEKHVMGQIHLEFSTLFRDWFSMLIDDEMLSVRLDDTFTPVIEQNGYETSFDNLSGGEKTSVALAYRLALNKVLNDFISHIRTKDLIMLDEPTDGFSAEQLDKVRELLDELNVRQAIIVSHEPKIESYVTNVLRIVKEEHVSRS